MIRLLCRLAGFLLFAAAFAAFIVDGTRSIAARNVMVFTLEQTGGTLAPAGLAAVTRSLAGGAPLAPLRPLVTALLGLPTSLALVLVSLALLYAGRRPLPRIGFTSRP